MNIHLTNKGFYPHHALHENGGADEISVLGLSGLLADPQTPSAHTHDDRYYTETEIGTWRSSVTQTEMGYLDGVTSDIQMQLNGKEAAGISVLETDFNADTFLYATNNNTPVATSPANVLAALSGHAAAAFDWNNQEVVNIAKLGVGTSTPDTLISAIEPGVTEEAGVLGSPYTNRMIQVQGDGGAYFRGRDVTNNIEFVMGTTSAGAAYLASYTNHPLLFRVNNNEKMRITTAGYFGFMTNNPAGLIDLEGNVYLTTETSPTEDYDLLDFHTGHSNYTMLFRLKPDGTPTYDNYGMINIGSAIQVWGNDDNSNRQRGIIGCELDGDVVIATEGRGTSEAPGIRFMPNQTTAMYIDKDGNTGFGGIVDPATLVELAATEVITGNVTDDYSAALTLDPAYSADSANSYTITRHNYIDVNQVAVANAGAGDLTLTDACLFRFDAAAGTHKAVDAGTTHPDIDATDAWMKVNINGTIHYIPCYTDKSA